MKTIRARPEGLAVGNNDRNQMLRSTPKNVEKFAMALKSYRQDTAANDYTAYLERSAA
jgi:hypothetical protein